MDPVWQVWLATYIHKLYYGDRAKNINFMESWPNLAPFLRSFYVCAHKEAPPAPVCWILEIMDFKIFGQIFALSVVFWFGFLVWVLTKVLRPKNAKESKSKRKACKSKRREIIGRNYEEVVQVQLRAMEEELECPVCLEVVTTSPLYKCADDHLICPRCRPKVKRCPLCRETYPRGGYRRFRVAERQAERLVRLRAQLGQ